MVGLLRRMNAKRRRERSRFRDVLHDNARLHIQIGVAFLNMCAAVLLSYLIFGLRSLWRRPVGLESGKRDHSGSPRVEANQFYR